MNKKMKRYTHVMVFTLLLNVLYAPAQNNLHFTRLGVNDGLSQNSVSSIMQDKQGFMWIATGDGLNRYDGNTFKIFRFSLKDSSGRSLPGRAINGAIAEDHNENLWFVTERRLVRMNKHKEIFTVINIPPLDYESEVVSMMEGRYLIIKNFKSIFIYDIADNAMKVLLFPIPFNIAYKDGVLLIADDSKKIYIYSIATNQVATHNLGMNIFRGCASKVADEWFLQGRKQIFAYDTKNKTLKPIFTFTRLQQQESKGIRPIIGTADGYLYMGTNGDGIIRINTRNSTATKIVHDYNNISSISGNYTKCIYVDGNQNI